MPAKSSKPMLILLALFLFAYALLVSYYYNNMHSYAIEQANKRLQSFLIQHKAVHRYVENTQKPAIYELKKRGALYPEYFAPQVLSFTYIARNIHENNLNIHKESGLIPYHYKLASNNPRNPINQATDKEKELLKLVNTTDQKEFKEIVERDGQKYLYYASAVDPNKASCMQCHGDPNNAPKEMIAMYGDKNGFFEKLGEIRAIISLEIPFACELAEAQKLFYIYSGISAAVLALLYFFIYMILSNQRRYYEHHKALQDNLVAQQSKMAAMGEMMDVILHQWKQPLSSLSLTAEEISEMAESGELDNTLAKQYADQSISQIHFMSKTLNAFRDYFRQGTHRHNFDIKSELATLLEVFDKLFQKESIVISVTGEGFMIEGYPDQMKQVLLNLLTNAKEAIIQRRTKSGQWFEGRITVTLDPVTATVNIEDNGGGIPPEYLPTLFAQGATHKEGGSGIGLFISKKIIEEGFGGQIGVANGAEGACFTLWLRKV